MEKVWGELKKIEDQAQEIHSDAQKNAKEITSLAQQEAENLVLDGKKYAREEADQLYAHAVDEANRKRDQQLEKTKAAAEKLGVQAGERMGNAVAAAVKVVLGEKV